MIEKGITMRRRQQKKPQNAANASPSAQVLHSSPPKERERCCNIFKSLRRIGSKRTKHKYNPWRNKGFRKITGIILALSFILILSFWHNSIHYILPATSNTFISPILGFHPEWHPIQRSDRFPSVEDRLKLYMSNFYLPPCIDTGDKTATVTVDERFRFSYNFDSSSEKYPEIKLRRFNDQRVVAQLTTKVGTDIPIVLWEDALDPCYLRRFTNNYCSDAMKIATLAKHVTDKKNLGELPPIIAQFGDISDADLQQENVPYLTKFRKAASKVAIEKVTNPRSGLDCKAVTGGRRKLATQSQISKEIESSNGEVLSPIIWPLNYRRHFGYVPSVKWLDTPWELKKNVAIWRGLLTGFLSDDDLKLTFKERCNKLPRCRFVRDNINTPGLDVGFSGQLDHNPVDDENLHMIKDRKLRITHMRYKAIIIMEGNDVSSGLKWALYSRSVVLMPPPTKTSFSMEELLTPWVHYVPLKPDLSDISEKMNWIIDHDGEARKIAERATLFIHDLLFHADAGEDNRLIQDEILSRYMKFFVPE